MKSEHTRPDHPGPPIPPEDAELLDFAESLSRVVQRNAQETDLPVALEMRLRRMTADYQPDDSRAWVFFGAFAVLAIGAVGAVIWTPFILVGAAVLILVAGAADRAAEAIWDRGLRSLLREAVRRR